MNEIIANGRRYTAREFVREQLKVDFVLAHPELRDRLLAELDQMSRFAENVAKTPPLALKKSFRRSLIENVISSFGETACGVGLVLTAISGSLSWQQVLFILGGASVFLAIYLVVVVRIVLRWYRKYLVPVGFEPSNASLVIEAASRYHREVAPRVPRYGIPFYLAATTLTVSFAGGSFLMPLGIASIVAVLANFLFFVRLQQTDFVGIVEALGGRLDDEDRKRLQPHQPGRSLLDRFFAPLPGLDATKRHIFLQTIIVTLFLATGTIRLALEEELSRRLTVGCLLIVGLAAVGVSLLLRLRHLYGPVRLNSMVHDPVTEEQQMVEEQQIIVERKLRRAYGG